jgi:hypothetical protein
MFFKYNNKFSSSSLDNLLNVLYISLSNKFEIFIKLLFLFPGPIIRSDKVFK